MNHLPPISSCCGSYLVAKKGTNILVCSKCDSEFRLIQISNYFNQKFLKWYHNFLDKINEEKWK